MNEQETETVQVCMVFDMTYGTVYRNEVATRAVYIAEVRNFYDINSGDLLSDFDTWVPDDE